MSTAPPLLPHQERALAALVEWFNRNEQRGVLCLPTGAGKTRVAASFVMRHVVDRGPVLWLAHRVELIDQALRALGSTQSEAAKPVTLGRWHGARTYGAVDVLVASLPTLTFAHRRSGGRGLRRMLDAHPRFALVVVDECHHGVAETWSWLLEELRRLLPEAPVLGLSATPTRHAAQEQPLLWKLFSEIIHEEPALDLIDDGVLARPTILTVDTKVTFEATELERTEFERRGDLPESLVRRIAENEARNDAVVDTYLERRNSWGQTLVFAAMVEHGKRIAARLRDCGVSVVEAYATTPAEERKRYVEAFLENRTRVMVNVGLFTEGTDLPGVDTLFLARPTRSRILFQQMVGRGMRGPKVGGAESFTVVAFHESIVGLVQERLASSFGSEREALAALGLIGERLPHRPAAKPTPHEAAKDKLVEAIRELMKGRLESKTRNAKFLRGFWEAHWRNSKAYLPVFGYELSMTTSWVNYLQYQCRGQGRPATQAAVPEGLQVPAQVISPFVQLATLPGSRVRWIDFERADREVLESITTSIQELPKAPDVVGPLTAPVLPSAVRTQTDELLADLRKKPRDTWRETIQRARLYGGLRNAKDDTDAAIELLAAAMGAD